MQEARKEKRLFKRRLWIDLRTISVSSLCFFLCDEYYDKHVFSASFHWYIRFSASDVIGQSNYL